MGDFYRPYPNEVYRINELLPEKLMEGGEAFFIDTFDYTNRCVNFSFVDPAKRRFNGNFKAENILKFFEKSDNWRVLCNCSKYYPNKAKQHIKLFDSLRTKTFLSEEDQIDFHYTLLHLYNFFPKRSDMHIDGVLKNIASKLANRPDESDSRFKAVFVETLKSSKLPEWLEKIISNKADNRWLRMKFMDPDGQPIEVECEHHDENMTDSDKTYYFDQHNPDNPDGESLDKTKYKERQNFFDEYLWPIFYLPDFYGYRDNGLGTEQSEATSKMPHYFLLVPVFSVAIGEKDYGTILGHFYVSFFEGKTLERAFLKDDELNRVLLEELKNTAKNENERQSKCEEVKRQVSKKKELIELLWKTWAPLAAQAILHGRENDLLAQPIEYGDDILKDFLSKITYVQDWEKVMVFSNHKLNKQNEWKMPEYCFKRYRGGKKGDRLPFEEVWDICQPSSQNPNRCSACVNDLNRYKNGNNSGFKVDGKCYFRFDLEYILDEKILPSMDAKDEAENSHRILFFQFPAGTFFPVETSSKDAKNEAITKLGEHYRNRMLPVFDKLLLKRNVLHHSTKAAVSAIISRNHSHHIGSHVTPRATVEKIVERLQYLGYKSQGVVKIASMRKAVEKARQEIDQRTIEIEDAMEDLKALVEEVSSSFKEDDKVVILLKTRLDKYIQQKADFTAEIGTEPLVTTKSASFFREIFIPFLENTLMLDGIGANEGVRYKTLLKNRLKLHLLFNGAEVEAEWNCSEDKSPHKYPYHSYPYSGHCTQCDVPTELKELKEISGDYKKDIKIAVPGPLGEFAIYSILENFIRNAIKHNRTILGLENGGRDGLDIFMDIVELDKDDPDRDDYYKVQIWDNLTKPCECRKIATDEGEKTVTLKNMLAELIKRSIVDNQGKLKKGAWGIAEMKIMATLLRGSDDFSNMAANFRVSCQHKDGQDSLVYEFYVMKPKEIAVISDTKIHETKRDSLRADGVWYFSGLDEFSHHFEEGKSIASFQFGIFNKPEPEKLTDRVLARLPSRVIINKCSEDLRTPKGWSIVEDGSDLAKSIAECASAENIINETWKHWIKFLMNKHKLDSFRLMVYLQQKKCNDPTRQWRGLVKKCGESLPFCIDIAYDDGWKDNSTSAIKDLVYDRHAGIIRDIDWEKNRFYEAVDKGSSDFSNVFAKPASCTTACEFAEAGMLNVLIMDERIAERAHDVMAVEDALRDKLKKNKSPIRRIELAKIANISLCTHLSIDKIDKPLHEHVVKKKPCMKISVGLGKKDDKLSINSFETFYGGNRENVFYDIVIIHQGVLEGFIRDYIAPFNYDDFLAVLREKIPYIVITSGRGIPHDVPDSAKFLPFSLLEDFVMKGGIAKYRLSRVIMELIRRDV